MTDSPPAAPRLFGRGSWPEAGRVADILRKETIGGALLLAGAVAAPVWANSPWSGTYQAMQDATFGPATLHLDRSLATWAADALLAIFFFVTFIPVPRIHARFGVHFGDEHLVTLERGLAQPTIRERAP